jgi:hypothetical protein
MVGISQILDMGERNEKERVGTDNSIQSERDGRNLASPTLVVERLKATFNLSFCSFHAIANPSQLSIFCPKAPKHR